METFWVGGSSSTWEGNTDEPAFSWCRRHPLWCDTTTQCNTVKYIVILYNTVQYTTTQCNAVQYCTNTLKYSVMQYNTVQIQNNTIQWSAIKYSTLQHSVMQCNTLQYCPIQCNAVGWNMKFANNSQDYRREYVTDWIAGRL